MERQTFGGDLLVAWKLTKLGRFLSGNRPSGIGADYAMQHKQVCEVVDPCTEGANPCPNNAKCIFLGLTMSPSYKCEVSA